MDLLLDRALELSGYYIPQDSSTHTFTNPRRLDSFFINPPVGFEGNNFLWLQADQMRTELRTTLANGDVLTGSPVQLEPDLGRQGITPRVRVQLEGMLPVSGTGVAVRTDRITRIVGSAEAPLGQEPPPGTVQLADGRRLVGRSIKWREYGLARSPACSFKAELSYDSRAQAGDYEPARRAVASYFTLSSPPRRF